MSHLLQISLGPVQGFIAASRKTRDLRAGSRLLQELAQVVSRTVEGRGGHLIFPAHPDQPAANIVLARVDGDPGAIAAAAREAAMAHLVRAVEASLGRTPAGGFADAARAREQAERFLEWFAAWTPSTEKGYAADRKRVGQLAAARKSLRDFQAPPSPAGHPKSPLDPRFDTIFQTEGPGFQLPRRLLERTPALKPKEVLDAVSFFKRFGDLDEAAFPSVRRVAVLHLLEASDAARAAAEELDGLLADDGLDAADAIFDPEAVRDLPRAAELRRALLEASKDEGRPAPYYAVIHGDGDGMGAFLDSVEDEDVHRKLSDRLSQFALAAERRVRELGGVPIFAGGDDVLALAPTPRVLDIVRELQAEFTAEMAGLPGENRPTLTLGVGISHVMDSLQDAVRLAKEMETFGKQHPGKNALAVGVQTRSGGLSKFRLGWNDDPVGALRRLVEDFEARRLSRGFPYEIRRLSEEAAQVAALGEPDAGRVEDLIAGEYRRLARRKNPGAGPMEHDLPEWARTPEGLENYAGMLAAAHFMTRRREEGGE